MSHRARPPDAPRACAARWLGPRRDDHPDAQHRVPRVQARQHRADRHGGGKTADSHLVGAGTLAAELLSQHRIKRKGRHGVPAVPVLIAAMLDAGSVSRIATRPADGACR